jgi:hypothetical protein
VKPAVFNQKELQNAILSLFGQENTWSLPPLLTKRGPFFGNSAGGAYVAGEDAMLSHASAWSTARCDQSPSIATAAIGAELGRVAGFEPRPSFSTRDDAIAGTNAYVARSRAAASGRTNIYGAHFGSTTSSEHELAGSEARTPRKTPIKTHLPGAARLITAGERSVLEISRHHGMKCSSADTPSCTHHANPSAKMAVQSGCFRVKWVTIARGFVVQLTWNDRGGSPATRTAICDTAAPPGTVYPEIGGACSPRPLHT